MTIAVLVGIPVAAAVAYAIWLARGFRTLQRTVQANDAQPDDEPDVTLDFWQQRRAR